MFRKNMFSNRNEPTLKVNIIYVYMLFEHVEGIVKFGNPAGPSSGYRDYQGRRRHGTFLILLWIKLLNASGYDSFCLVNFVSMLGKCSFVLVWIIFLPCWLNFL